MSGTGVTKSNSHDKKTPLMKLMSLLPSREQQWSIVTYVLNQDYHDVNDNLHGYVLSFGSFESAEAAEKEVRRLIEASGYQQFFIQKYGTLLPLQDKDSSPGTQVFVSESGQALAWDQEKERRDAKEYEQFMKIKKEVSAEAALETDPTTVEYFKRQCFLAIQHQSSYREHHKLAQKSHEEYLLCRERIRTHYHLYPEHETQWLPQLKQVLTYRGEARLYQSIEFGYQAIRDDLLGESQNNVDNGDVDTDDKVEEFKYS